MQPHRPTLTALLLATAAVSLPPLTRADSLTLSPTDAQAETQTGSTWTLNTTSDSLNASRFSNGLERRGIMEFNLSSLPAGATITSATFDFRINQYTSSTNSFPVIQFHGYAGNGVMEIADATRPLNLIGTSPTISALTAYSTPLSASYVQSLLGTGSQLGLFTYQGTLDRQASFYSTDAWYVDPTERPRLTIQYTLPPAQNILVTGEDSAIREYTRTGSPVRTLGIPTPPAPYDTGPRGTTVDHKGRIHVYNGTFDPHVSTYDPATVAWSHRTAPGLSTINNGSYGSVASFGSYLFASDMATAGTPGSLNGIVRFNTATGAVDRFGGSASSTSDVSNLTRGLDGLLYALSGSSSERNTVRVFNPYSMSLIRTVTLPVGVRGIAINAAGDIFATTWGGTLYHFTPAGSTVKSLAVGGLASDLDLAPDGSIVVGTWASGVYLTNESMLSATQIVSGTLDAEFVSFATPAPLTGWKADTHANWTDATRWNGPVPNSPAGAAPSVANFGPVTTAPRSILLPTGTNVTVSTLNFDAPHAYTLSGGGSVTLDQPTGRPTVNVATGQHRLDARLVLAKPSTIAAPNPDTAFLISTRGTLDLGPYSLIWDYAPDQSPIDALRAHLSRGRGTGAWTGTTGGVITSSTAAADPKSLTAIAYTEASTFNLTTFAGRPVDPSTLILLLAQYGDANLSGTVNADDYIILDRSLALNLTNAHWTDGDFNYDGTVNDQDYLLIDRTLLSQSTTPSPDLLALRAAQFGDAYVTQLLTSIPEPSSLLLSTLCFLLPRPRRLRPVAN